MCHTKVNKFHRVCTPPAGQLARISTPSHARDLAWEVAYSSTILTFGWVPEWDGRFSGRTVMARSTRNEPVLFKCIVREQTTGESSHPFPNADPNLLIKRHIRYISAFCPRAISSPSSFCLSTNLPSARLVPPFRQADAGRQGRKPTDTNKGKRGFALMELVSRSRHA